MSKELVKPVDPYILTEEELKLLERKFFIDSDFGKEHFPSVEYLIVSNRNLLSANAELSFENMLRKKYEGFLLSVIRSGEKLNDGEDYEWFKHHMGSSSILSEVYK